MIEILSLIIGTILGWYGREWIEDFLKKRKQIKASSRIEILHSEKIKNWLIDYYVENDFEEHLFLSSINGEKKSIPFLTKENWYGKLFSTKPFLKIKNNEKNCQVKIKDKYIKKRKHFGQNIWNDTILCLESVNDTQSSIHIDAMKCEFYQYVCRCGVLEDETINIIKNNWEKTPFRDECAKTLLELSSGSLEASGIGLNCLIAYKDNSSYKFILQRRTNELFTGGGFIAVTPCSYIEPLKNMDGNGDIILYNFLKELYEELYDQEELIRSKQRLRDDWFYQQDPISTLLNLKINGEFSLHVIGFGFDALTGEVNISALAIIDNQSFIEKELSRMKYNWEIKGIEILDYHSEKLNEWFNSGLLIPNSAFSITIAQNLLDNKNKFGI